ncbi:MAG: hypothetical protein WC867_03805 [Candidatus Pacearchaeota archaeon]|jgi:ABC-type polysaccharide/polyol phosphate export permease
MRKKEAIQEKVRNVLRLGFSLAKANFKLRNEGSYLGIFWYLLEPLLLFLILIAINPLFQGSLDSSYPLYLLLGLILFNFFSQTSIMSTDIIEANKFYIKSIKISYESLILSSFLQNLFSHFFEIIIFLFLFLFYQQISFMIFSYIIVIALLGSFTIGISMLLSTIGVYSSDFNNVWRVLIRLLWFITPIFYYVPKQYENLFLLNPLYCYITLARKLMINNKFPSYTLWVFSLVYSLIFLFLGYYIFYKYKSKFAEYV